MLNCRELTQNLQKIKHKIYMLKWIKHFWFRLFYWQESFWRRWYSKLPSTTSDNSLTPALSYYGTKTRVKFTGSCLKQPKVSYTHGKVVNIYIAYELGASGSHNNDPALKKLFIWCSYFN